MKKYIFRDGSPYNKEDAPQVGAYLEKMFPGQDPTPDQVVEIARPKNSPIHKFFDWDNESAAQKYRLQQARRLITSLVVISPKGKVQAYHHVYIQEQDASTYLGSDLILQDQDLSLQVVQKALQELSWFKLKYESYSKYFVTIFRAIDETSEKIKEVTNGNEEKDRRRTKNRNPTHRAKNR